VDAIVSLSSHLERLADSVNQGGKLSATVQNFNRTSEELRLTVSENRAVLRRTLEDFNAASRTVKGLTADRDAELRRAMDHFGSAAEKMDRLTGRLDSLRAVVQSTASRVENGEGTLGKLVRDDQLYTELSSTAQSLRALIEDIKKNPKKYLKVSIF
jgi:phospholipid/cholesterol/gamma-HCH transport system substrate-binding protein